MDEMYQQIIDFAELREFENRPFKQLSSGMKSRLAFSICQSGAAGYPHSGRGAVGG